VKYERIAEVRHESRANSGSLLSSDQIQIEKMGALLGTETTKARHRIKAQVFSISPTFLMDKKTVRGSIQNPNQPFNPYSERTEHVETKNTPPKETEKQIPHQNLSFNESSKEVNFTHT